MSDQQSCPTESAHGSVGHFLPAGIAVAGIIMRSGYGMGVEAVRELTDEVVDLETLAEASSSQYCGVCVLG